MIKTKAESRLRSKDEEASSKRKKSESEVALLFNKQNRKDHVKAASFNKYLLASQLFDLFFM